VDLHAVNRAALEAAVRAGAVDFAGVSRARIVAAIERAMALGATASADRSAGQLGLFGEGVAAAEPDYPVVAEWSETERMAREREAIGFYATDHPLARHERVLRLFASQTTAGLVHVQDRDRVRLGGMILAPRVTLVKSGPNEGRKMAFFTLEDFAGGVECVLFARGYAEMGALVEADRVVVLEGRLDRGRETPSVQVDRLVALEDAPRLMARGLLVRMERTDADALGGLRTALSRFAGDLPVVLEFRPEPGTLARVRAGPSWCVAPTETLLADIQRLPGVAAAEYLARDP
jgi:DNA polymerase-3 subunit alpha